VILCSAASVKALSTNLKKERSLFFGFVDLILCYKINLEEFQNGKSGKRYVCGNDEKIRT
jgi:hypothetical protein